ncbi:MAG: hypothetical protein IPL71_21685 [Anaerolineales bacterium]|uniref:DUF6438 domain-containing protein n=1 Tax=Candidatus Villigracilis proximus TaxID=3140683 RepID=UPI003135EE8C|nr:hypothetical protein [Anaerolineales bacterium]
MKLSTFFLLSTCIVLVACSTSFDDRNTPVYPDLLISMTRISGFGVGPQYKLEVHADGTVDFEGIGVDDKQSTTLTTEQIQEIVTAIEDTNFFLLDDQYLEPAIDFPSVRLTITLKGQTKSIWHYGMHNCSDYYDDTQHQLCRLEDKIDEITNSLYWVNQEW